MSIAAVALLQDPVRRRLYEYVAAADHEVNRDEAAEATEIKRCLAVSLPGTTRPFSIRQRADRLIL